MKETKKTNPFNLEKIKENLPKYSMEKLCELVVCDRYFGFDNAIQIICMEELARRREAGDTFDFETYIDKSFKELPVINLNATNIREMMTSVIASATKGRK